MEKFAFYLNSFLKCCLSLNYYIFRDIYGFVHALVYENELQRFEYGG